MYELKISLVVFTDQCWRSFAGKRVSQSIKISEFEVLGTLRQGGQGEWIWTKKRVGLD